MENIFFDEIFVYKVNILKIFNSDAENSVLKDIVKNITNNIEDVLKLISNKIVENVYYISENEVKFFVKDKNVYKTEIINKFEINKKFGLNFVENLYIFFKNNSYDMDFFIDLITNDKSPPVTKKYKKSIKHRKGRKNYLLNNKRFGDLVEDGNKIRFKKTEIVYNKNFPKRGWITFVKNNRSENRLFSAREIYEGTEKFGYKGLNYWLPLIDKEI